MYNIYCIGCLEIILVIIQNFEYLKALILTYNTSFFIQNNLYEFTAHRHIQKDILYKTPFLRLVLKIFDIQK